MPGASGALSKVRRDHCSAIPTVDGFVRVENAGGPGLGRSPARAPVEVLLGVPERSPDCRPFGVVRERAQHHDHEAHGNDEEPDLLLDVELLASRECDRIGDQPQAENDEDDPDAGDLSVHSKVR